VAHLGPFSTALAVSEKCKSMLPCAIQMKNLLKTISIREKLDVISWLEKR
jgi:hypothetical protein